MQLMDVPAGEYLVFEHGPFDFETQNAAVEAKIEQVMRDFDYAATVQYPFGYGLRRQRLAARPDAGQGVLLLPRLRAVFQIRAAGVQGLKQQHSPGRSHRERPGLCSAYVVM